jgi:hypothetical protein
MVRALPGALEQEAFTVKVQFMLKDPLAQNLTGILQNRVQSGVAKLLNSTAIGA